MRMRIHRSIM